MKMTNILLRLKKRFETCSQYLFFLVKHGGITCKKHSVATKQIWSKAEILLSEPDLHRKMKLEGFSFRNEARGTWDI